MTLTTTMHRKATKHLDSMEIVSVDGREIGIVTKYKNTKYEKHPYKAYRGIGYAAKYLGHLPFYGSVGRRKAINTILDAEKER